MPETQIIFTCHQASEELCVNELLKTEGDVRFCKWLDHGVGVICYSGTFSEFAQKAREFGFIYALHIFPIDYMIPCGQDGQPEQDTEYLALLDELSKKMFKDAPFSVQFRCASKEGQNRLHENKRETVLFFQNKGFRLQIDHPVQIISGFLSGGYLHLGLSSAQDNLSDWAGGMRAYAFREDTISRAEFKLMEAIECFHLSFREGGLAVDLGAAPGGWTKVLLENGLRVIAVDPAELDPSVLKNAGVTHYRGLSQRFLEDNQQEFDVLVNDMRMDTMESVKITNEMAGRLKQGGYLIMTFKLQKSNKTATIRKGLELLRKKFSILHTKQMFHNRLEVTVIARKENE